MYLTENLKFHLAENLKFLREQNGKTQGELAVLFGIEQKTISSWECGSRKPPIGTIVSLAKLYRVSLDDLVLTDMRPPIPVYALNLAYLRRIFTTLAERSWLIWSFLPARILIHFSK